MIIGTAGHVDHGKTALVKALTGVDADRLAEEKRRGITIDLGYAYTGDLGFIDVPGHERFVHTMLAGASGIDAALLVVALPEGIRPQTREHLQILSLLGIDQGVVALTMADLAADRIPEVDGRGAGAAGGHAAGRGADPPGVGGDGAGDRGVARCVAGVGGAGSGPGWLSAAGGGPGVHAVRRRADRDGHAGVGAHRGGGPAGAVALRPGTAGARAARAEQAGRRSGGGAAGGAEHHRAPAVEGGRDAWRLGAASGCPCADRRAGCADDAAGGCCEGDAAGHARCICIWVRRT